MSYILDALKKSEKQRQRGAVPDILTVQDVAVPGPKTRLMWPYLLAAVLLLNAGLFVWWISSPQSKDPNRVEQAVAQKREDHAVTPVPKITTNEKRATTKDNTPALNQVGKRPADPGPAAINERPAVQLGSPVEKPVTTEAVGLHDNPAPVPASNQAPVSRPAPETKPAEAVIPPPENRIYNLTDLPSVVRQGLPQFSISTHIHSSDPSSRLVRINGQTLREGQEVAPGLRLEEITPDGVIFRYQDYRVRVGVR